jgi:four helix bundle protein
MSELEHAGSFRDLVAYRKADSVAKLILSVTKNFPREEMYSLTDQIHRSSRSMGPQIAESRSKRRYEKHFISKLTDADGEQQETQHWIDTAADCEYLTDEDVRSLNGQPAEVGKMLNSMIGKAVFFCGETPGMARESAAENFADTDYR